MSDISSVSSAAIPDLEGSPNAAVSLKVAQVARDVEKDQADAALQLLDQAAQSAAAPKGQGNMINTVA